MNISEFLDRFSLELDDQQREAVLSVKGPTMILAVPGSGKTTVLVSRLGYMVYGLNINPKSILTVTYTVAATNDMKRRFESYFGPEYAKDLEFRTINGISQKILSYYGHITNRTPFEVADKELPLIIREAYMAVNDGFPTENDISTIALGIGYCKNNMYSEDMIKKYKCDVDNFYEVYTVYNQLLKKRSLIDYDDQMVYALKILKSVPAVLEYFQKQYEYFCVDEAQDTSKIQHEIMELLASGSGNIFMVGDEDQSIYGFRAAYPKALLDFEKRHKGARVFFLETNYRSGKEIITAASVTIKKNKNRHDKRLIAAREDSGKVARLDTASRKSQYRYLAEVCQMRQADTAILYRNNESALPLIDILERNNIPYRLKNSDGSFFSHPVVNDIKDFISLAYNPMDDQAFMRIYYKMGLKLSKVLAQGAVYNCGSEGFIEYLIEQKSVSEAMRKKLITLSVNFGRLRKEKADTAIELIVENMGYGKYMESRGLDRTKVDILRLIGTEVKSLRELVDRLGILQEIVANGSTSREANVTLSTIHSAKGLEFDRVYMMDLVEGVLPSVKKPGRYASAEEVDAYEEERRLYYVGMTRARNELYIFTFDYDSSSQFSRELFGMKRPADSIPQRAKSNAGVPSYLKTNYGKARPKSEN